MATYNLKYNSDDAIIRHIIIGLLADLNNKVWFQRQVDKDTRKDIDVPFYYSITGDDQFLRDNFLFTTPTGEDCYPDPGFADGNYDVVPRGVARISSISIDSSKLVNRRIMGEYTRLDQEGSLQSYSSEFEMIPITLNFDIEVLVSSTLDALKITEMIIKRLYKSNYFNVEVGHLDEGTYRLASYYALPDDYTVESPIDFGFDDKDKYNITFPIEVNSFIPSFSNTPDGGAGTGGEAGTGGSVSYGPNGARHYGGGGNSEFHSGNRMFEIKQKSITSNRGESQNKQIQAKEDDPNIIDENDI
jgi:hypothetical protein